MQAVRRRLPLFIRAALSRFHLRRRRLFPRQRRRLHPRVHFPVSLTALLRQLVAIGRQGGQGLPVRGTTTAQAHSNCHRTGVGTAQVPMGTRATLREGKGREKVAKAAEEVGLTLLTAAKEGKDLTPLTAAKEGKDLAPLTAAKEEKDLALLTAEKEEKDLTLLTAAKEEKDLAVAKEGKEASVEGGETEPRTRKWANISTETCLVQHVLLVAVLNIFFLLLTSLFSSHTPVACDWHRRPCHLGKNRRHLGKNRRETSFAWPGAASLTPYHIPKRNRVPSLRDSDRHLSLSSWVLPGLQSHTRTLVCLR